jgi:pilus assembly protein FimV
VDLIEEDTISIDPDEDDGLSDLGDEFSLDVDDDGAITINLDDDEDFDLEEDGGNKLDLARAYIDMGDGDGARDVLEKVIKVGSHSEVQEASELLDKIG